MTVLYETRGELNDPPAVFQTNGSTPMVAMATLSKKLKPNSHLITQHNYHDHASDPIVSEVISLTSRSPILTSTVAAPFPAKLHKMLEQMETEGMSNVVSWQPHGRCFKVHQISAFKLILQQFFRLSKMASFQRQLNLYGFRRITVGLDRGSYYHELFLRSRPDLASQIIRIRIKGTRVRAKSNPDDEPNFYSYPPIGPKVEKLTALGKVQQAGISQAMNQFAHGKSSGLSLPAWPDFRGIVKITPSSMMDLGTVCNENLADNNKSYDTSSERSNMTKNGLIHNLSLLHFRSLDDKNGEPLRSGTRQSDMRTQSRPTFPSTQLPVLLKRSSCNVGNDRYTTASMYSEEGAKSSLVNGLTVNCDHNNNVWEDYSPSHRENQDRIQHVHCPSKYEDDEDDIAFDKLVDEIFQNNDHDDLSFYDTLQLATTTATADY